MIEFTLPLPCSVNELYTVARGRKILSKKAIEWKKEAYIELIVKKIPIIRLQGNVSIVYDFKFPDNRKRDISNYIKQLEDILVYCNIIEDDSLVMAFSATKTIFKGVREVKVQIKEISEAKPL